MGCLLCTGNHSRAQGGNREQSTAPTLMELTFSGGRQTVNKKQVCDKMSVALKKAKAEVWTCAWGVMASYSHPEKQGGNRITERVCL